MTTVLAIVAALVLDAALGEPPRLHPLVGFGRLAQAAETRLYGGAQTIPRARKARGTLAVALTILPFGLAVFVARRMLPDFAGAALDTGLLYLAIGWKSLRQHAERVRAALAKDDLPAARSAVAMIVSRDTQALDSGEVSKAAIESVLENGNDAVFGAIFWFAIAGGAGAVVFRLSNTLDAMWGYRNERYRDFGWAAARLDDVLNFFPARLTALAYALGAPFGGHTRRALECWRTQGRRWKSPNAGPVMAAGAGSLGVELGGPACYHGSVQMRPALGGGRAPTSNDIPRALALLRTSLAIWIAALAGGAGLVRTFLR